MRGAAELTDSVETAQPETPVVRKLDRLALLYEGILTVASRIRTGRQQLLDPEEFRHRMKKTLDQVAVTATKRGYSRRGIEEATFAVVAFLDEAILTAPDVGSINWVGKTLAEELFNERSAGELFFKRLDALRTHRDSQDLAEILEVHQLCLLLGYEGKYAGGAKGELQQLMANLRERIERILGKEPELSPDVEPDKPLARPVTPVDTLSQRLRWIVLAMFLLSMVCYIGFSANLHNKLNEIHQLVMQRIGPSTDGARP
jgi:type VI secretion system protein ImpK